MIIISFINKIPAYELVMSVRKETDQSKKQYKLFRMVYLKCPNCKYLCNERGRNVLYVSLSYIGWEFYAFLYNLIIPNSANI